jgi:selenide,water dikinase
LYLTKPLGVGILTTAEKKGIVQGEHLRRAVDSMLTLNSLGSLAGKMPYVTAMTDVTGFGLLGHLSEVCEGSGLSAEIEFQKIPAFDFLESYIAQKSIPGGTNRNWDSYGSKVHPLPYEQMALLADPQTSGGLLMAVDAQHTGEFEQAMRAQGYQLTSFGKLVKKGANVVTVR